MDLPDTLAEIERFKRTFEEHFTCFDPAEVDEFRAPHDGAFRIGRKAARPSTWPARTACSPSRPPRSRRSARHPRPDLRAGFKMIDQSDMIVSLIPELPGGRPALSSGVERELHHAFEAGKEVYVVWRCAAMPSPFVSETATKNL